MDDESAICCELLLWQLADAVFPSGGLAHSGGLEAAVRWAQVRDSADLVRLLSDQLTQIARSMLPLLRAAHAEPKRFGEIDRLCQAMLSNHVANRASRAQGKSLAMAAAAAFDKPAITELARPTGHEQRHMHLAPTFGAIVAALELPGDLAARLFLYITLRSSISSAVRLNVVGPLEAQAIQYRLAPLVALLSRRSAEFELVDATQTAPILDLLQATQDRLYSRLFQS
jgi:urease accessory protein